MDQWWINGEPGRLVDVTDRGLAYADGLFETIAVRGQAPRFLDLHLARLEEGCLRLGLALPVGPPALEDQIRTRAADVVDGVLKLLVTRGVGPRGYGPPRRPRATIALGLQPQPPEPWRAIRLRWCTTVAGRSPATAGLKTLARLEQVLARGEWDDDSADEGLMAGEDGWVVGGTSTNVFLVAAGQLVTPAITTSGIRGVMRRVLLREALAAGVPVVEGRISRADVMAADELLVTNALTGLRPVSRLAARAWPVGPVTRMLAGRLAAAGVVECAAPC